LRESAGQRAADKAADAGEEDAHHRRLSEKPWPAQIYSSRGTKAEPQAKRFFEPRTTRKTRKQNGEVARVPSEATSAIGANDRE
jgi:hypothetical protein